MPDPSVSQSVANLEGGAMDDYRDEGFAACDGEEPPCWVSVEKRDGTERSEREALKLADEWWGESPDEAWTITRVPMYVGPDGYGGLRVNVEPIDGGIGPVEFWKIDES